MVTWNHFHDCFREGISGMKGPIPGSTRIHSTIKTTPPFPWTVMELFESIFSHPQSGNVAQTVADLKPLNQDEQTEDL